MGFDDEEGKFKNYAGMTNEEIYKDRGLSVIDQKLMVKKKSDKHFGDIRAEEEKRYPDNPHYRKYYAYHIKFEGLNEKHLDIRNK